MSDEPKETKTEYYLKYIFAMMIFMTICIILEGCGQFLTALGDP